MPHSRMLTLIACIFLFFNLTGMALEAAIYAPPSPFIPSYNHVQPARPYDNEIEEIVRAAMTDKDSSLSSRVSVHSFYGHVYLVGDPGPTFALFAEKTAHYVDASHYVTGHWFPEDTADKDNDQRLKNAVAYNLRSINMRPENQVAVEVCGGNVIVMGVVTTPEAVAEGEKLARIPGVKTVRSYLMTSEQALKPIGNASDLYHK